LTAENESVTDFRERWRSPFTQLEMREMWTYSDGDLTVRAYRWSDGTAESGNWALVDQATGNVQGVARAGEFSRRFRPVDAFAEVTGFPTYLGTVTASDGTALVDLVLDRNPFMLANGLRRTARPHVLMVPRSHRDGWSSATAQELAARHTAMSLVAGWYRSLDDGHAVFCANDSAPNLDYLRDTEASSGTNAGRRTGTTVRRNPRQEVQHAHLHAFYAERDETENHESSALKGYPVVAQGHSAFSEALDGDAVRVEGNGAGLATSIRIAVQPWGSSYCSYQLGVNGPLWVMSALGPSQDELNRRLARADGLQAEPDPKLGGAVNLVRPSLADAERLQAARRATVEHRAGFEAFVAKRGLNGRSLPENLHLAGDHPLSLPPGAAKTT
jgi:diadenosine tetraphosphate (Ap4A) HIT family hydrolase